MDPAQKPIEDGLLAIDYFRAQLSTPVQFALYNVLVKYLRKDRDNYGFKRVVYDQRTPDTKPIPALMSRDEFERELRENGEDDSFDPPIPLVPAIMDGFQGCLARIAAQKETTERAMTAAKVSDKDCC